MLIGHKFSSHGVLECILSQGSVMEGVEYVPPALPVNDGNDDDASVDNRAGGDELFTDWMDDLFQFSHADVEHLI